MVYSRFHVDDGEVDTSNLVDLILAHTAIVVLLMVFFACLFVSFRKKSKKRYLKP